MATPDELPMEVWKIVGDISIPSRLKNLFNMALKEEKMPEKCRDSFVIPILKVPKGDVHEYGNYSHNMRIWKNTIDKTIKPNYLYRT